MKTPIALTIAGSDSGGGAGIQADLKAFSALGVYGASVITAVTAQNTAAVTAVHEIPVEIVTAQIKAVLDDLAVDAIKIGMLFSSTLIDAVADALEGVEVPIILDPVMIAKSGDPLLQDDAILALKTRLLPRADLVTPNLPEAEALTGKNMDQDAQAQVLLELGARAALVKGGHGAGDICVDLLADMHGTRELKSPRIATQNTHGTGCTLSAAIASGCAKGLALPEAVTQAHQYLHKAIKAADELTIGAGHGPVHHFHDLWRAT